MAGSEPAAGASPGRQRKVDRALRRAGEGRGVTSRLKQVIDYVAGPVPVSATGGTLSRRPHEREPDGARATATETPTHAGNGADPEEGPSR